MNRVLLIVVVGLIFTAAAVGGLKTAMTPPAPQADAVDARMETRLQALGLTEEQLEDTIISGVEAFIARQQQAQREAQQQELRAAAENLRPASPDEDFIQGDESAEFSLIEYSDFECPFCKRFHDTASSFNANNDNLNRVYRHFPLPNHNPQAMQAAIGAECVGRELGTEAYWAFNDAYYAGTRSGGRGLEDQSVAELMVATGMSSEATESCLSDPEMQARVETMLDEGQRAGVSGTPGIFIRHNPTGQALRVPGAVPLPDLQGRFDSFAAQTGG
ncbi:hypothetical protein E4656_01345 [Natronospirillum operosum]|uniref:Thioredoxin-like fold domain-containing protein n=1 Tax=Natronospirillum operosum TaxID=2759953 RepID=A0A4Z0WHE5_9GAMM|nr:thioredoxin domain-containing protein [Natronospirillum operosum]TGG95101.1 hypothetical protein E4656_01345 [Natronospirillum operosum]